MEANPELWRQPGPERGGGIHLPHSPKTPRSPRTGLPLLPSAPRRARPPERCRLPLQLGLFPPPNSSLVPPPSITPVKEFQTEIVP